MPMYQPVGGGREHRLALVLACLQAAACPFADVGQPEVSCMQRTAVGTQPLMLRRLISVVPQLGTISAAAAGRSLHAVELMLGLCNRR